MRRSHVIAALAAAALLLAVSPVRALSWIVPGVANTAGANGTRFVSDLTIVNAGAADRDVTLSLIPGPATIQPPSSNFTVLAGKTLRLDGVLGTVWLLNGTGAIRVTADGPLALFARTYNLQFPPLISEVPPWTFGAALPIFEEGSLLVPGEQGHSVWATQSADIAKGDRTNVAVVFPDEAGGAATATLFDDQGTSLGSVSYDSPRPAFQQRSLAAFTTAEVVFGRVAVTVTRGRACGYTATADNGSGDLTILPTDRPPPDAGAFSAVSSGVAQTPGASGAFWQTEARLANVTGRTIFVTAYLLGIPGQLPRADFVVGAGKMFGTRSLVTSAFNFSGSVAGAVLWTSEGPLLIAARTSSTALPFATGTAGDGRAAVPVAAFLSPSDGPADVAGLSSSSFSRTNLLVTAGPAGATYTLEARDEDGRANGFFRGTLPVLGWGEFRVADLFPSAGNHLRVRVTVESGSANMQVAVADSSTNDFVLYEALPRAVASSTPPLPPGIWGSADGTEGLKVDATTIQVDRHCRKGTFPQPGRLDAHGNFAVVGEYVVMVGPVTGLTAILTGQTDGQKVTVSVSALEGFSLDVPTTFFLGKPYTIPSPGGCPIEY
jgi:hypothetical protein